MSILVATDFAACSSTALALAGDLAALLGADLRLAHVIEPTPLLSAGIALGTTGWELSLKQAADDRLEQLRGDLGRRGVKASGVVLFGDAAQQIVSAARDTNASLIVLGTHGRRGAAHFFLGSVAEQVARLATCPTVVVRAAARPALADRPLRILVALDGGAGDEAAVAWGRALRGRIACDVTTVRVYWPPREAMRLGIDDPWFRNEGHPQLVQALDREVARLVGELPGQGAIHRRYHTSRGNGADGIADEAALTLPDLVVTGVHPTLWLEPFPSLSPPALLRAVHAPVVCVPVAPPAATRPAIPRHRAVLVACDLSDAAARTIPEAYALLRGTGGTIELLHVHERGPASDVTPELPHLPPMDAEERTRVEERLRALVPVSSEALGIHTNVSVVEARSAAEGILQAAERLAVDVISVASRGRTGLGRALLGSVAETVSRHSTRPVLIVPARKE